MSDEERTPPTRIRVTGLQEAQVADLERFECEAANELGELGVERPPKRSSEIARLTRTHDIYVVEADHVPAGYLAWRDEQPGVAVIEALVVGLEYRRFAIGTRLLRELGEHAKKKGLGEVVVRCHPKATAGQAFLAVSGFSPLEATTAVPAKLAEWRSAHAAELAAGPDRTLWRKAAKLGIQELTGA